MKLFTESKSAMQFFRLGILLFFVFSCAGCNVQSDLTQENWFSENGKLKVLSTIGMIDDLVQQVGNEHVDCLPLIRGELDPHSYELVKGDDELFNRADLIFYNGLGLEHGLTLRKQLESNKKAIAISDPLREKKPEKLLFLEGQVDPHIWMDCALWAYAVDAIESALIDKDPKNKEAYQRNAELLRQRLFQLDEAIYTELQKIPEQQRYLVTSHDAFRYFTKHYLATKEEGETGFWEKRCEAPEGLAPDAQLSVSDIQNILDHIVKYKVSVLFPESNVSRDSLKKILNAAKKKGLVIHLCTEPLYGDSMGPGGYYEMLVHNATVISNALRKN